MDLQKKSSSRRDGKHNKLRKSLHDNDIKVKIEKMDKKFKKDPYRFAKNLFSQNSENKGAPTFSAKDASDYFSKLYRDENRDYKYSPPIGLKRPKLPEFAFSDRCPTFKELKRSVKRKRNAAAPGLNSLPYVPYKKCNSILNFIHKLGNQNMEIRSNS